MIVPLLRKSWQMDGLKKRRGRQAVSALSQDKGKIRDPLFLKTTNADLPLLAVCPNTYVDFPVPGEDVVSCTPSRWHVTSQSGVLQLGVFPYGNNAYFSISFHQVSYLARAGIAHLEKHLFEYLLGEDVISPEFLFATGYRIKGIVRVVLESLIRMVSLNES